VKIKLVVSGRAYPRAASLPDALDVDEGCTLAEALARVAAMLPDGQGLPSAGLVAVGGQHAGTVCRHSNPTLRDGEELVIVVPVAGG